MYLLYIKYWHVGKKSNFAGNCGQGLIFQISYEMITRVRSSILRTSVVCQSIKIFGVVLSNNTQKGLSKLC